MNTKTPIKSRRGLSFFTGFIGAYLIPPALNNLLILLGFHNTLSATNTEYIAYATAGILLGISSMLIAPVHRGRILSYIIGSLVLMDAIAFFSGRLPLAFLLDRSVYFFAFSLSGVVSFFGFKESESTSEASTLD